MSIAYGPHLALTWLSRDRGDGCRRPLLLLLLVLLLLVRIGLRRLSLRLSLGILVRLRLRMVLLMVLLLGVNGMRRILGGLSKRNM